MADYHEAHILYLQSPDGVKPEVRDSAKMKPVKLCAEHLGLLQPAVALGDAALLLA